MNKLINVQEDEIAIRNLLNDVITAFNEANLEKLLSYHTDDIILMEPNMPIIHGKNQVRELFEDFKKKKIKMQLGFDILELEVNEKRAFVRGQVRKTVLQNGAENGHDTGKFICLLRKQHDGTWLRTHVIVNSDQPALNN